LHLRSGVGVRAPAGRYRSADPFARLPSGLPGVKTVWTVAMKQVDRGPGDGCAERARADCGCGFTVHCRHDHQSDMFCNGSRRGPAWRRTLWSQRKPRLGHGAPGAIAGCGLGVRRLPSARASPQDRATVNWRDCAKRYRIAPTSRRPWTSAIRWRVRADSFRRAIGWTRHS